MSSRQKNKMALRFGWRQKNMSNSSRRPYIQKLFLRLARSELFSTEAGVTRGRNLAKGLSNANK